MTSGTNVARVELMVGGAAAPAKTPQSGGGKAGGLGTGARSHAAYSAEEAGAAEWNPGGGGGGAGAEAFTQGALLVACLVVARVWGARRRAEGVRARGEESAALAQAVRRAGLTRTERRALRKVAAGSVDASVRTEATISIRAAALLLTPSGFVRARARSRVNGVLSRREERALDRAAERVFG